MTDSGSSRTQAAGDDASSGVLFPLWQVDRDEYAAACRYLGLTPSERLYERLAAHLAQLPFREPCPTGFALHLARLRLTRFRIARLDLVAKLLYRGHPTRHRLNALIALHECDSGGSRELARTATGAAVWAALIRTGLGFALGALLTSVWLIWQWAGHVIATAFRRRAELCGRRVLVTGAGSGLGHDLALHCLERGAKVVGTVRTDRARRDLAARIPTAAPLELVVADLGQADALAGALRTAGIDPDTIDIAFACAGVKHAGVAAISVDELRQTFEVNLFANVALANWYLEARDPPTSAANRRKALVLLSSMGRWHGMHGSGGYNASKAALSIWGESLELDLHKQARDRATITVVEPGLFVSPMTRPSALTRWLLAPRRKVAEAIVSAALAGRRTLRPPFWFALLTWAVCLGGRGLRLRLFGQIRRESE